MLGVTRIVYKDTRYIGFILIDRTVRIYRVTGNKRCKLRITPKGSNRRLTYIKTISADYLDDEWKESYREHKFLSSIDN